MGPVLGTCKLMLRSALVGLGVIILSLPLPGLSARLIQKFDKERLKRTDARVQTITEGPSVG